jgi:hypothetical protein
MVIAIEVRLALWSFGRAFVLLGFGVIRLCLGFYFLLGVLALIGLLLLGGFLLVELEVLQAPLFRWPWAEACTFRSWRCLSLKLKLRLSLQLIGTGGGGLTPPPDKTVPQYNVQDTRIKYLTCGFAARYGAVYLPPFSPTGARTCPFACGGRTYARMLVMPCPCPSLPRYTPEHKRSREFKL